MTYLEITKNTKLTRKEALNLLLSAYQDNNETRSLLDTPGVVPCGCNILKISQNIIFLASDEILSDFSITGRIKPKNGSEGEKTALIADLALYTSSEIALMSPQRPCKDRRISQKLKKLGLKLAGKTTEENWHMRPDGVREYITDQENIIILDGMGFDWGELSQFCIDISRGMTSEMVCEAKEKFNQGGFRRDASP